MKSDFFENLCNHFDILCLDCIVAICDVTGYVVPPSVMFYGIPIVSLLIVAGLTWLLTSRLRTRSNESN